MSNATWRIVAAAAAAVTIACGAFALGAAMTSAGGGGSAAPDDASATTAAGEPPAAGSAATGSVAAGSTPPAGAGQAVTIDGFAFGPAELSVPVGSTITWTNEDDVTHNVFTGDDVLASPDLAQGDTYEATLDVAGPVAYYCDIHQYMKGTITVTP